MIELREMEIWKVVEMSNLSGQASKMLECEYLLGICWEKKVTTVMSDAKL